MEQTSPLSQMTNPLANGAATHWQGYTPRDGFGIECERTPAGPASALRPSICSGVAALHLNDSGIVARESREQKKGSIAARFGPPDQTICVPVQLEMEKAFSQ
jgi:hypothetical protein